MLKIRIEGTPDDIDNFLQDFCEKYDVLQRSAPYANRAPSKYARVYLDVAQPASDGATGEKNDEKTNERTNGCLARSNIY